MDLTGSENLKFPESLPVLPLRDVVVFPYLIMPLAVGREASVETVQRAMSGDRMLLLVTQKEPSMEEPTGDDLHPVGTIGAIMRMVKQPDGRLRILVQGLRRAKIEQYLPDEPPLTAKIVPIEEEEYTEPSVNIEAFMRTVREQIHRIGELNKNLNPDFVSAVDTVIEPGRLADLIASNLDMKVADAQKCLEIVDPADRLQHVINVLTGEVDLLKVQARIAESARDSIEQHQQEYFLREQLKAIQSELGVGDDRAKEVKKLREQLEAAKLPEQALDVAEKELERLEHMHSDSSEAQIVRTYLDWIISLPWNKRSRDRIDIKNAKDILNEDHFGLDEVKERIIEFLAVRKLNPKGKSPILCFIGPPGVGKTSLGRSIARSMGRKFVRISLGGMRDEAEIRGHRRTYIGAMPGRIVQSLKQAGTNNPIFMLDEIDKLGSDFRGDPSSALLEVLDPEQNDTFSDNYLNVTFDLSRVMFITTANMFDPIPGPLRDRMEIIELPGYTLGEKIQIAYRYLLPRQIEQNGLKSEMINISHSAMEAIVEGYTREAGLRNLERTIGKICRKVARKVAEGSIKQAKITGGTLGSYLGLPRFQKDDAQLGGNRVGLATGLAWTPVGGEILNIEVSFVEGKGGLSLTGQLGQVMKESAQAALTYARSRAAQYDIKPSFFAEHDIHIHVPAGAIPKDGPSAGITMATALFSAMVGRPTLPHIAMTGEVTLRGNVLPIGGIKEKVLAAQRMGITDIVLPVANRKDVTTIPSGIRRKLNFHYVSSMDEVMDLAVEKVK